MKKTYESAASRQRALGRRAATAAIVSCLVVGMFPAAAFASKSISQGQAVAIAAKNAGVSTKSSKFHLEDADLERGSKGKVWDLEFKYGATEYEYVIDAKTGKVLKKDKEIGKTAAKKAALKRAKISSSSVKSWTVSHKDKAGYYYVAMVSKVYKRTMHVDEATGKVTNFKKIKVGKATSSSYIGAAKAKSIALSNAKSAYGMPGTPGYVKAELDWERGVRVYEVEFQYRGYEYDYDIDAKSGKILKKHRELDD